MYRPERLYVFNVQYKPSLLAVVAAVNSRAAVFRIAYG